MTFFLLVSLLIHRQHSLILWTALIFLLILELSKHSRRTCAIRIDNDNLRLMFINVYMPYEGDDRMTDEFADQLEIMDSIKSSNLDCHIIAGGDFNVDLSRLCMGSDCYAE